MTKLKTRWATQNALKNCRDHITLALPDSPSHSFDDPSGAAKDLIDDFFTLQASLGASRERERELVEAANWVLHVASGVGKDGGPPSDKEYEEAMDALKQALTPKGEK